MAENTSDLQTQRHRFYDSCSEPIAATVTDDVRRDVARECCWLIATHTWVILAEVDDARRE